MPLQAPPVPTEGTKRQCPALFSNWQKSDPKIAGTWIAKSHGTPSPREVVWWAPRHLVFTLRSYLIVFDDSFGIWMSMSIFYTKTLPLGWAFRAAAERPLGTLASQITVPGFDSQLQRPTNMHLSEAALMNEILGSLHPTVRPGWSPAPSVGSA